MLTKSGRPLMNGPNLHIDAAVYCVFLLVVPSAAILYIQLALVTADGSVRCYAVNAVRAPDGLAQRCFLVDDAWAPHWRRSGCFSAVTVPVTAPPASAMVANSFAIIRHSGTIDRHGLPSLKLSTFHLSCTPTTAMPS